MSNQEGIMAERGDMHFRVHHEDGTFWTEVEEFPGCFAAGQTREEFGESVVEAVQLYTGRRIQIQSMTTDDQGAEEIIARYA